MEESEIYGEDGLFVLGGGGKECGDGEEGEIVMGPCNEWDLLCLLVVLIEQRERKAVKFNGMRLKLITFPYTHLCR